MDISLIRFFLKGFFLFYGKNAWHIFEKKYLDYFIDPLCGYAGWNYSKIILDKKGFRNSLSWTTDSYLKRKKIDWEKIMNNYKL